MKCHDARGMLSPYIDGQLSEKSQNWLRDHLAACPDCRQRLAEMRKVIGLLNDLPELEAPAGLMDEFHQRLMQEKVVVINEHQAARARAGWIAASVAGIAVAFGVFISSVLPYPMVANLVKQLPLPVISKEDGTRIDIEELIRQKEWELKVARQEKGNKTAPQPGKSSAQVADRNKSGEVKVADNTAPPEQTAGTRSVDNSPKSFATVNMQLKGGEADKITGEVLKVASVGNGQVEAYVPQMMTGGETRGYTIWVPQDQIDDVVAGLKKMGSVSNPVEGSQDVTQEYTRIQKRLVDVAKEIADLESKGSLKADQEEKLDVLRFEQEHLNRSKADIDAKLNLVAINLLVTLDSNQ